MLIVNLTTTHSRLDLCSATIWSLINQKKMPDKIVLWLSTEAYLSDKGICDIPTWFYLFNDFKNVLEIKYTKNTGPYRKIIPALRTASTDDILVYADDDVIYGQDWLSLLFQKYSEFSGKHIVATRVRLRKKNFLRSYQSYNRYDIVREDRLFKEDFIITGVGGCILSTRHISKCYSFSDEYLSLAERNDDLWISKIIQLTGTQVATCVNALGEIHEIQHDVNALNSLNTVGNKNYGIRRIFYKIYYKVCGYFGFTLSQNDVVLKKIDMFFEK